MRSTRSPSRNDNVSGLYEPACQERLRKASLGSSSLSNLQNENHHPNKPATGFNAALSFKELSGKVISGAGGGKSYLKMDKNEM